MLYTKNKQENVLNTKEEYTKKKKLVLIKSRRFYICKNSTYNIINIL